MPILSDLGIQTAYADDLQLPSNADLNAQMAKQRQSFSTTLSHKVDPVKPGTFKTVVPDMKAPPPTRTQDLDALIEQYKAAQGGRVRPNKPGSDLIIFVSFSMPTDTLIALSKEAKEAGAVMVVRGFKDGSLRATKQAALDVNKGHAPWEINPGLFRSFQIKSVPTFVVADSQAESVLDNGCSPQATFSAVSGDISVELALEQLRLHAQTKIADMADKRLKDLHAKRRAASLG